MRNPRTIGRTDFAGAAVAALVACLAFGGVASAQDQSFGKDIPISLAAKSIVPSGFKVEMGEGVDGGKPVSWSKSESWKKSISAAAASGGYVATVDGQVVRIAAKKGALPSVRTVSMRGGDAAAPVDAPDAAAAPDDGAARREAREERRVSLDRSRHRHVADEAGYGRRREPRRHEARFRGERHRVDVSERVEEEAVDGPVVPDSGFVLMPRHAERHVAERRAERVEASDVDAGQGHGGGAFVAVAGESLSATLQEWAEREGWRLEWKSDFQYALKSSARFNGDFVSATTELLRSMAAVRPQPTAEFFKGNKVLVVGNNGLDEAAAK